MRITRRNLLLGLGLGGVATAIPLSVQAAPANPLGWTLADLEHGATLLPAEHAVNELRCSVETRRHIIHLHDFEHRQMWLGAPYVKALLNPKEHYNFVRIDAIKEMALGLVIFVKWGHDGSGHEPWKRWREWTYKPSTRKMVGYREQRSRTDYRKIEGLERG